MADNFGIHLEGLGTTRMGTLEGRISVRLGDTWFPGASWADLPVPVLLGFAEILTAKPRYGEVHFLDGPYLLKLVRTASGDWLIEAVHSGRQKETVCSVEVPENSILREVRSALAAIRRFERGGSRFHGTDSERVQTAFEQVDRLLQRNSGST